MPQRTGYLFSFQYLFLALQQHPHRAVHSSHWALHKEQKASQSKVLRHPRGEKHQQVHMNDLAKILFFMHEIFSRYHVTLPWLLPQTSCRDRALPTPPIPLLREASTRLAPVPRSGAGGQGGEGIWSALGHRCPNAFRSTLPSWKLLSAGQQGGAGAEPSAQGAGKGLGVPRGAAGPPGAGWACFLST